MNAFPAAPIYLNSLYAPLRTILISTIVTLVAAPIHSAHAQLLDYGTFSGYGIGKGLLGNDYANPLPPCITWHEIPLAAAHAEVRVSIVYDKNQYKQAFHIDQKADVSILKIASGGDELHIGRDTEQSGSAFDIVVEAYAERNSSTVDAQPTWISPYREMMATGDPPKIAAVRQICGDRFIQTVFNESRLFAVLHVSSEQTSSLTQFKLNTNAKFGIDVVSASGSLGGDINIQRANQSGAIHVEVFSEGIGGLIPTLQVVGITNTDGLAGIAQKLVDYLNKLEQQAPPPPGQPVKYQLAPLPGMPIGDLQNERIFERLADMKMRYLGFHQNLDNINALLGPDLRRTIFRQPQADALLKKQQATLSDYIDLVASAHQTCRLASQVGICNDVAKKLDPAPAPTAVDLPPIQPPFVARYSFEINGRPVAPGQADLFMQNSFLAPGTGTLFDAAKTIDPEVANVDLTAPIFSAYVSHIDLLVVNPPAANVLFGTTVGGGRLIAADLSWPPYGPPNAEGNKGLVFPITPLRMLHADANSPCEILHVGDATVVDKTCLTSAGKMMRDVGFAYLANHVVETAAGTSKVYPPHPINATISDCFSPPVPIPAIGYITITVAPGPAANMITGKFTVGLPTLGFFGVNLAVEEETHDLPTWKQLAKSTIQGLNMPRNLPVVPSPCSPHVP
jgi:hypothetical protein